MSAYWSAVRVCDAKLSDAKLSKLWVHTWLLGKNVDPQTVVMQMPIFATQVGRSARLRKQVPGLQASGSLV